MYNRYLQNDHGDYEPIPVPDAPPENASIQPEPPRRAAEAPAFERFLPRVLEKVNLKDVDTADILLLLILFFLFEEKADDELLIALGLLLIL